MGEICERERSSYLTAAALSISDFLSGHGDGAKAVRLTTATGREGRINFRVKRTKYEPLLTPAPGRYSLSAFSISEDL